METKDNIVLDRFSRSILDENHGIELLYSNEVIDTLEFENNDDARQYNYLCNELDLNPLHILLYFSSSSYPPFAIYLS